MDNVVATINQLLIITNRVKKTIDVQQSARKTVSNFFKSSGRLI